MLLQKFEKWQGCGNDFILIETPIKQNYDCEEIKSLCDRHFGIGADGVIYVLSSSLADMKIKIFNADGTEAEMCGNGVRCVAKYFLDKNLDTSEKSLRVETQIGILTVELKNNLLTVDMGEPIFEADKIPVKNFGTRQIINESLEIDGTKYGITCVSMGNPHCVVFVKDINDIKLCELGKKFETNEIFPRKTNTEFVQIIGENKLRMRVWERGSGVTLACGTGACATAVAAHLNKLSSRKSSVILDGGELEIYWREDNHILMTGTAEKVFTGEF